MMVRQEIRYTALNPISMQEIKEENAMKKSFRGFTLIECLIALAILGIASLVMAQIYAKWVAQI